MASVTTQLYYFPSPAEGIAGFAGPPQLPHQDVWPTFKDAYTDLLLGDDQRRGPLLTPHETLSPGPHGSPQSTHTKLQARGRLHLYEKQR